MHQLFYRQAITNILRAYFGINGACPIPEFFKYSEVSLEHREKKHQKKGLSSQTSTLFAQRNETEYADV